MCATMFAKILFSTRRLSANAQRQGRAECTQDPPQNMDQSGTGKTTSPYRALAWQTLSCSIPGSRFHHHLPVVHEQYTWKSRACSNLGQAWEETAYSSLQVYCEKAVYTVHRVSQGQLVEQQVPRKIFPWNCSIIITCTGKHGRRPTTIEMDS